MMIDDRSPSWWSYPHLELLISKGCAEKRSRKTKKNSSTKTRLRRLAISKISVHHGTTNFAVCVVLLYYFEEQPHARVYNSHFSQQQASNGTRSNWRKYFLLLPYFFFLHRVVPILLRKTKKSLFPIRY